jgi:putative effector of murein hydrolase
MLGQVKLPAASVLQWAALSLAVPLVSWFGMAAQGFGLMVYQPFVTFPLMIAFAIAIVLDWPESVREREKVLRLSMMPLLFTAVIIIYGLVWRNRSGQSSADDGSMLLFLLSLQVIWSIYSVFRNACKWRVFVSSAILMLWMSLSVGFIVGMMVTGNWL